MLALLISTLAFQYQPKLFAAIIDGLATMATASEKAQDQAMHSVKKAVAALLAVSVIGSVASFVRSYIFGVAGERIVRSIRQRLFHKLVGFEIGFYDGTRVGELLSRLGGDTTVLQEACTTNAASALKHSIGALVSLSFLFSLSCRLALLVITTVPVLALVARRYGKYAKSLSKSARRSLAEASASAEETMSNIRTVRACAAEGRQEVVYGQQLDHTFRLGTRAALASAVFSGGTGALSTGVLVAVVFYGATLVLQGALSVGQLTSVLMYSGTLFSALASLAGLFGHLMQAAGASGRVFRLLDRVAPLPLDAGRALDPRSFRGEIVFDRVSFAYPTRPAAPVLRDVSFRIPPGSVCAFVGPSGSGKTTILHLIERFYDPGLGCVRVDGIDVRTLSGSSLRRVVGLVQQDYSLFSTTIRENIRFGRPEASDAEIEAAARIANAHDFIAAFPEGYDTVVGERGVRLSGGQRQRVTIARAVLSGCKALCLDEFVSNLDAESEHIVTVALHRLMAGKTTCLVAHRLNTVRSADIVFVVDCGRIVGQGKHDDLLKTNALYAKLVRRQLVGAQQMAAAGEQRAAQQRSDDEQKEAPPRRIGAVAEYRHPRRSTSWFSDASTSDAEFSGAIEEEEDEEDMGLGSSAGGLLSATPASAFRIGGRRRSDSGGWSDSDAELSTPLRATHWRSRVELPPPSPASSEKPLVSSSPRSPARPVGPAAYGEGDTRISIEMPTRRVQRLSRPRWL
jgi:ABC-type multidrug transport system fused ATPase/permease subunit